MTRPTARVLALLEILQAGGTRTASDLAVRLEVDERTVRRYVDHLIDLDIPVRSVRGRYGGYRLTPGYRIPPLMLTDDEALAVLLGLVAGLRAGLVTTSATAMENAAAKIRRVLPEALGRRLDALLATADFTTAARPGATQETGVLVMLAEAARERRPVAVAGVAHEDDSERDGGDQEAAQGEQQNLPQPEPRGLLPLRAQHELDGTERQRTRAAQKRRYQAVTWMVTPPRRPRPRQIAPRRGR